jgi:hypothetical protein
MLQHILFGCIPKIGWHNLVNPGVANNGKLPVNSGYIYQYPVPEGCFVHIKLKKIFSCPVKHILATFFFDTNPYLATAAALGLLNSLTDALLFFFVKYRHGFNY